MGDRWQLFRNRSLGRLLAAFALLNLSEWGFVTAFSIYAYRHGGTLDVGLIGLRLLAGAVSGAVLSPLLSGRPGVLSLIALTRAVLLGAAAVMVLSGAGFLLALVFLVLDSVAAAGYRPAQSRLMPSLARSPAELTQAVAGVSMAKTLGQAAGALIGGIAVDFVAPGAAMAGLAGVMVLALASGAGLRGRVIADNDDDKGTLRIGLAAFPAVLGDGRAWPLVWAGVLRTLVRGLWGALLVVVALHMLHTKNSGVGILQAAAAVGAVVALPITATQIGRARLVLPCLASFILAGVAVGLVGAAQALAVVIILVAIWGASMAIADATSMSLLHRLLNADALTSTVGVMESLKLVSEGAGALLAPALVALFGLRSALVIAGLPLPLLMLATSARVRNSDLLAAGRGLMVTLLHGVEIFRGLDMASIEQLAAHAHAAEVQAGADVVTQGAPGDLFYVIEQGEAQVLIDGYEIRVLGRGEDFGERALLRNTPRTATVRATTDMRLYALERDDFLSAVTGVAGAHSVRRDLDGVPLPQLLAELAPLRRVPMPELVRLAASATRERFDQDVTLFQEGDPSDRVYVIIEGSVALHRDGAVTSVLEVGDIFGELGVLYNVPRAATAKALEPLRLLTLPAGAFRAATGGPG